ncbi:pyrroline-5-carboxylate reductase [Candidatus Woesearchaeota archaeon]|nr:pyrroline-5-carboxylate reductase [Candidatus Woesearchaeota archaeon]
MAKKLSLGFIGAGKMASALITAIRNSGISCSITVSDRKRAKLGLLRRKAGIIPASSNSEVARKSDIIFLCMKPQDIDAVLDDLGSSDQFRLPKKKLIVSIAAGIRIGRISKKLPQAGIIRVMPNTPCIAGEMAAGFSAGKNVSRKSIAAVSRILNSAGKAFLLPEHCLDAVTAVSGSGPAFFAYLFGLFIHAGRKYGLPKKAARELVLQTAKGTAILLEKTGMEPEELISMVSSPNGTTVAGRKVLEHPYTSRLIRDTVAAAVRRSGELASCRIKALGRSSE